MLNNLLIQGENLLGLQYLLDNYNLRGRVDFVYIDPPFATNEKFSIDLSGRVSTISRSSIGKEAYTDTLLGKEFIEYIKLRLLLIRELLSPVGSIYLHTDYKIGHYMKVMMDEVFGIDQFRNDISRVKCNPKNFKRIGYGNIKDMVLFYTKSKEAIWNEPYEEYQAEEIKRLFPKTSTEGRAYTTVPIHAPGEVENPQPFRGIYPPEGRHWRVSVSQLEDWDKQGLIEWSSSGNPRKIIYQGESQGKRVQDILLQFKDPQYPVYPTEKNRELIELFIRTSSNPDSIVLDCFCGSGTTLDAASRLGRKWIGIDRSSIAIETVKTRLGLMKNNLFGDYDSIIL